MASDGLRQMLWGFFKKIVIADNCATYANIIFNQSDDYTGSTLALGAVFFAFQIYGDFSGYSDIAIGSSRLFGFDLMRNFAYPYFSRDIAEFWRRWHISLSTWFRDYLYIPLGGSQGGLVSKVRNTFIIFVVSGFWHGANWTFIAWGALNALYFLPLLISGKNRQHLEVVAAGRLLPSFAEVISMGTTFCLTLIAWIFFRASNIKHAYSILTEIFSKSFFSVPEFDGRSESVMILVLIGFFIMVEWLGRSMAYPLAKIHLEFDRPKRYSVYFGLILMIFLFSGKEQEFIYFQF
jgi:alginate O-acetyltransferase complex protein AlgI